jgi:dUTP pyrophosphatase
MSGSVITKEDILELLRKKPSLIEELVDPTVQVGPDGVDLTIRAVESFRTNGVLDFDNSTRCLAATDRLEFNDSGSLFLSQGAYKVTYNEIVNIPHDMVAFGFPRSSLLRCGASVKSAIWDSGYRGRSVSLLNIYNPRGLEIKRNARIIQLIFLKTTRPVEELYSGIYQKENI